MLGGMPDYDLVIVGAGAAGLSLAHRVSGINERRARPLRSALVEPPPGPRTPPPRTWCFWETDGGPWDHLLTARWDDLSVIAPDGTEHRSSAAPYVYKMLRSTDMQAHVRDQSDRGRDDLRLTVGSVSDGPDHATVTARTPQGRTVHLTTRWVFDSRPTAPSERGRTRLLQHFRGWFVRARPGTFDPASAVLMDLRPPQPRRGVAFGYVLPLSDREALVEYTGFGREALSTQEYERALTDYCALTGLGEVEVLASEQGAIPMTDAPFPPRAGRRVFRIGTAGGATRPSTGYTFSGVCRQTAVVARALENGGVPVPPVPHRPRHLAMDAVMLRALDRGRVRGDDFFARLFAANRLADVLAFLDGGGHFGREVLMGLSTPVAAMSHTVLEHTWHGLCTRLRVLARDGRPSGGTPR